MKQVQLLRYLYLSGDDDDFTFFEYIHYIYIYLCSVFGVHICIPLYSTTLFFHDSSSPFLGVTEALFDDDEWMNSSFETFQNRYCFDNRFRILFKHDCSCFVALGRFSSY